MIILIFQEDNKVAQSAHAIAAFGLCSFICVAGVLSVAESMIVLQVICGPFFKRLAWVVFLPDVFVYNLGHMRGRKGRVFR
jgi:hypothetical protein